MSKLKKVAIVLTTITSLLFVKINCYAGGYTGNIVGTNDYGINFVSSFQNFISHYSLFITIMLGLMTIMSLALFVYHCFSLASSGSNAQKRALAMKNLLTTGICIAAQSSVSLILALLFWGFYV